MVAPLFKNNRAILMSKEMSIVAWSVLKNFLWRGALWFESTEQFCPSFPVPAILPRPQLLLRRGGGKEK